MLPYIDRIIAFDSNVLTYFLDANRGNYALTPNDPLAPQRVAAMRLFLYCRPFIMPTVKAEAERIRNPEKLEEHMRSIGLSFGEFVPDERQEASIKRRAGELQHQHHSAHARAVMRRARVHGGVVLVLPGHRIAGRHQHRRGASAEVS